MSEKDNTNPAIKEVLQEKDANKQKEIYNQYVDNMTPKSNPWLNCLKAFIVGGGICLLGEGIIQLFQFYGNDRELAALYGTIMLIGLSIIMTGLNVYQRLGQFAGAGSIVPITGFANSVASPALEFGVEGQVFGIGCQIFKIAGPVILYGIFSSWVLGLLYWIGKCLGWIG
ncbi:MAG: SpoVA/SpoVAEb family sporulation membrane protein [Lachnospiraceae bacterium]|nr:SpoVA/SpoVAEb family sporulation membrane protein [Lachnospiraceae bacterium]